MTLKELQEKRAERQKQLAKVFEEAKTEGGELDMSRVKCIDGDTTIAKVEKVRQMNAELDDLGSQIEALESFEKTSKALNEPERPAHADPSGEGGEGKGAGEPSGKMLDLSMGKRIMRHPGLKAALESGAKNFQFEVENYGLKEVKASFLTSAGWAPESTRTGMVVDAATRPIQLLDLIPDGQTGMNSVKYMRETTYTPNAGAIAEGGQYNEGTFELTEVDEPVRKVGTRVPVSDEQLEDVAMAESYLDQRLRFGTRQELDTQVATGDGVGDNLTGFLNRNGLQTQAKSTDPIPDAVHKAITKVRTVGRAIPGAVVMHSDDWQRVRLLRTTDGVYIWGSPSEAGPARMWGLPVAMNEALPEGTALVGDFANFSQLFERRGLNVQLGYVNDQFNRGMQTMRADVRAALAVMRAAAFCEVTGLNT